jgi:hypothetical protein
VTARRFINAVGVLGRGTLRRHGEDRLRFVLLPDRA